MLVTVDVSQYKAAVKFIVDNNSYLTDKNEEDIKKILDNLIAQAVRRNSIVSTAGFTVSHYEDVIDISVNPSVSQEIFYMEVNV